MSGPGTPDSSTSGAPAVSAGAARRPVPDPDEVAACMREKGRKQEKSSRKIKKKLVK